MAMYIDIHVCIYNIYVHIYICMYICSIIGDNETYECFRVLNY